MEILIRDLADDIEEREGAIYAIERVFFTDLYNFSDRHKQTIVVHTISMLYAIWEGCIQRSFQVYIDWMNRQSIQFDCVKDSIAVHCMESTFKQLFNYPDKEGRKRTFYDKLKLFFKEPNLTIPKVVDTKSNVSFDVLNNILTHFSLEKFTVDYKVYSREFSDTNLEGMLKTFLRYRNGVAHGGDITSEEVITRDVFIKYKDLVIFLMHEVESKITIGATNNSHLLL